MDAVRLPPQPKERGSVSRSTLTTKGAWSLSKLRFQAELLRVTYPCSNKFAQPAQTFSDSITKRHRETEGAPVSKPD
jgi:hypothetical protein